MWTILAENLLATHDAGAIDQAIEAAKGLDRRLHGGFGRRFVADVRHHAVRAKALGLGCNGFGVHVHQHHFRASSNQHLGGGGTEAGSATGDDKNLVLDLHHCFPGFKLEGSSPRPLEPWRFPGCAR
ncbi:hypothetical protein D3C86_1790410 [compost metagenome]